MNPALRLKISHGNVIAVVKIVVAINILLLAGTYAFNTAHSQVLRESDLASENVFAAWYSSMLLLLSAVMSCYCFLIDQRQSKVKTFWNFGWLIYAVAFALLSFDELGSIHEHIGNFTAFKEAGAVVSDTKESGWIFFYIIVGLVGLIMMAFGFLKLKSKKWSLIFMILGLLLYLSNPLQEYFEISTMRAYSGNEEWRRPVLLLLLEEGSELFGSLFFLLSVMLYSKNYLYTKEINKAALMRLPLFSLLVLVVGFVVLKLLFGDVKGDEQNGVPKNWITAAVAFLVSAFCTFLFNRQNNRSYLLFASFAVCLSIYFGSNRFAWYFNADYSSDRLLLKSFLAVLALVSYFLLLRAFRTSYLKYLSVASFVIVAAGIFIKRQYSAELVFFGIGLIAMLLLYHYFAVGSSAEPRLLSV